MSGRLRWRLVAAAGVAASTLGLAYVAWPVQHIPIYDANLTRLSESRLEGYCAGEAFWKSRGAGSASLAADCRARLAGRRPATPNLMAVQPAFCAAIVRGGWQGTAADCVAILTENEYWPTYNGALTNQWNRARPYPRPLIATNAPSGGDSGRTGGRNGNQRTNNPTHSVPRYP